MTFTPRGTNPSPWLLDAHLPAITIRQGAVDAIHRELRDDTHKLLENGGPLIGSAVDQRTITRAAGPGPTMRRRARRLEFDWLVDLAEPAKPDAVLGLWHSHPAGSQAHLSGADVACFRRLRSAMHRPLQDFVAILAVPSSGKHELRAWLVGPHNTQTARLVITPDPRPMRSARRPRAGGHKRPGMLVAKRAFAARYGNDTVQIALGERVTVDHAIARAYPQHFATA